MSYASGIRAIYMLLPCYYAMALRRRCCRAALILRQYAPLPPLICAFYAAAIAVSAIFTTHGQLLSFFLIDARLLSPYAISITDFADAFDADAITLRRSFPYA